jgi:hypothetical protein
VDSVGVRPCKNVWMQSFLLLRGCFSSGVATLINRLLSGVRNACQPLTSHLFFPFIFGNVVQVLYGKIDGSDCCVRLCTIVYIVFLVPYGIEV